MVCPIFLSIHIIVFINKTNIIALIKKSASATAAKDALELAAVDLKFKPADTSKLEKAIQSAKALKEKAEAEAYAAQLKAEKAAKKAAKKNK